MRGHYPWETIKPLVMKGLYPATVTPFTDDLQIDWPGLSRHIETTLSSENVNGVVVNSGLGEILQLEDDEKMEAIRLALRLRAPGQIVVAGIESHNPSHLVADGLRARDAGADALLVFPPFDKRAYRRLASDVESVEAVFSRLDREVGLPMVVFQYPVASNCAYSIPALKAIARLRNVVAVKTATEANLDTYKELWNSLHDDLSVLVGVDSPPLVDMLRHGAHGALIGISAVSTRHWAELLGLVADGRTAETDALYAKVCLPLMESIFQNQRPTHLTSEAAAMKEALFQMGEIASAATRPPALRPSAEVRRKIGASLRDAGLTAAG